LILCLSPVEIFGCGKMNPHLSKNREYKQSEGEKDSSGSSSVISYIYKYSEKFKNTWKIDKEALIGNNFEKCLRNAEKNAKKKIEKLRTYVRNERLSLEEESSEHYLLTFSADFRPHEHVSTGITPSYEPVNFKIWLDRKSSIVISVGANRIQSKVGVALLSCATAGNPLSIESLRLEKENFLKLKDWVLSTIKEQIKGITIYDVEYEGQKFEQISLRSNQLGDLLSGNLLNSASSVKNLSFTVALKYTTTYTLNCRITPTGELRIYSPKKLQDIGLSKIIEVIKEIIKATAILPSPKEESKKKAGNKKGALRKGKSREESKFKRKKIGLEERKEIDLGRKKSKPSKAQGQPSPEEGDKTSQGKETLAVIKSPFVEVNLEEAKIFLILPSQRFKFNDTAASVLQELNYKLELNGEERTTTVEVTKEDQGFAKVEERKIELEKPLKNFQVVFPDKLQGGIYSYKHGNVNFYVFTAIGNNRGRMHYLYDKEGNINPIPKRDVWILLKEDFELETKPDVIEERWVWEDYQPSLINLKKTTELVIKNRQNGERERIPCETTFSIEGEQLVEDDLKEQAPLFVGGSLKIKAPRENPSGWVIWLQSKVAGYRIITEKWTGVEPFCLKLPDDLPCEYGEFQVDICQHDITIPDETLFFRWIPSLKLQCPKNLIIPDSKQGHTVEYVIVKLDNLEEWELKTVEDVKIETTEANSCRIVIPPSNDVINFSLSKKRLPENEIPFKVTIPRLRWRTAKQDPWGDKLQTIERKSWVSGGEPLYLFVKTNDFNRYDLLATIEAHGQKLPGEEKFTRKGMEYLLDLSPFHDTIDLNKGEITLKIEIKAETSGEIVGNIEALCFPALSMLDLPYYRDKKSKENFTPEELNFLNQIFEICSKVLCTTTIIKWYEEGTISLPDLFKPYIDEVKEKEKSFHEEILKVQSPIDFSLFEHRDFETFFKDIEGILRLPVTLCLWFYNYITIPMIQKTRDALLFYLGFFKNQNIQYIFERQTYNKEFIDDNLSELLKQAQVSLGVKEEVDKDFVKNPRYRRYLFFDDLFKPGNMYYLVEKWKYYKAKEGNLNEMPSNSDQLLLGDKALEEARKMRFRRYIDHSGSREMTLRYRINYINYLNTKDKDKALKDALNFFSLYFQDLGD
jgi:hypothetical protein